MPNEASIDLIANPTKLNDALTIAGANTNKFVAKAKESMQGLDKSAKGITGDFTAIGAAAIKNAPSILALAFSFTKLSFQIEAAQMATELLAEQMDATGHSIGVIDDRLTTSQKILQESRGDIDKLNEKLAELGVSAEDAGIKFETNLSRVKDSWRELFQELANKDAPEEIKKVSNLFTDFSDELARGHERDMRGFSDFFKGIADNGKAAIKELRGDFQEWFLEIQGFNQEQIKQLREQERAAEQAVEDSKVREIRENLYKQELADFQEFGNKRAQYLKDQSVAEIAQLSESRTFLKERLQGLQEERRELILNGQWHGKIIDDWVAKDGALFQRQQELLNQSKQLARAMHDELGPKGTRGREDDAQEERELNAARANGVGFARAMLDITTEEVEQLYREKDTVENIVIWQEKVNEALKRLAMFRRADHDAKLQEIDKENAAQQHADDLRKAALKSQRDAQKEIAAVQAETSQDRQLRDLEKQGVGLRKLHELKMQFIKDEETRQLSNLEMQDPVVIESIKARAEMQRIKEVADFQQRAEADRREAVKIREAEQARLEDERIAQSGASERELHNRRIQRIKTEADELNKTANTQVEKEQIKIALQHKLNEEKQLFLQMQKDGVSVDAHANAKPLTGAEQRAQARKSREAAVAASKKKHSKEGRAAEKQRKIQEAAQKRANSPAFRRAQAIKAGRQDERMKGALQAQAVGNVLKDAFEKFENVKEKVEEMKLAREDNNLLKFVATYSGNQLTALRGIALTLEAIAKSNKGLK